MESGFGNTFGNPTFNAVDAVTNKNALLLQGPQSGRVDIHGRARSFSPGISYILC